MKQWILLGLLIILSIPVIAGPAPVVEIKDWVASGSGCFGRMGQEGKVDLKIIPTPQDPLKMTLVFDLGSYELDGNKAITHRPSFARECAIRIATYPKAGFRLRTASTQSSFVINKDKGIDASAQSRLLAGSFPLGTWTKEFPKTAQYTKRPLKLKLSADTEAQEFLRQSPCGQPRLVGVDISFLNKRESFKPKILVKNVKNLQLEMVFEKCKA